MRQTTRTLFGMLALVTSVVFQAPTTWVPPSALGAGCPPGIAAMSAKGPDQTIKCHGWLTRDFLAGAAPADVLARSERPYAGGQCDDIHYYLAAVVGSTVTFAFAGGVARGTLPLAVDQLRMVGVADPYVVDVELGSYEPGRTGLICSLNRTNHFFCPATGAVDQFCITWLRRSRIAVPG